MVTKGHHHHHLRHPFRFLLFRMSVFLYRNFCQPFVSAKQNIAILCTRARNSNNLTGTVPYPVQPWETLNPEEYFTPHNKDEQDANLADFWFRFNFNQNLTLLGELVERFGVERVIRAEDGAGKTVAHWIADKGTKYALKYIAETDPASVDTWKADRHQPLVHLALMSNNLEVLDMLLKEYGFDVNITDTYGCTAMMRAAGSGHNQFSTHKSYEIILRCAIYGIDVNQVNAEVGMSALHYAVQRHIPQDVHLLLHLGTKVDVPDNWNRTPLDFAVNSGDKALVKLLTPTEQYRPFTSGQKVALYWKLLKESRVFCAQQAMYWAGAFFSTAHMALFAFYLLPMYFLYYIGRTSTIWLFHLVFISCMVFALIAGGRTVFSTAGFIPTNSLDYNMLFKLILDPNLSASSRIKSLDSVLRTVPRHRLCHICRCIAPPYSKHCYLCGRCCLDYDHHCVFLFSCISGASNLYQFILFGFMLGTCGLLGLGLVIYSLLLDYGHAGQQDPTLSCFGKLFNTMSLFAGFNALVCFKFLLTGYSLALSSSVGRKRTLEGRAWAKSVHDDDDNDERANVHLV